MIDEEAMGIFDFLRGTKVESAQEASNMREKPNIDDPISGMGTPLFNACLSGDVGGVKILLDAGANPNARSYVNYPEDELFKPGIAQEVGALLYENTMAYRKNPSFFHRMELGLTNLYYPVLHGNVEIANLLLEAGADPNAISFDGLFPLYIAAEIGNLQIVMDLVGHGAEVNMTTPKGCTAILNAAEEGNLHVVDYLLGHAADPFIRNNAGNTAIDAALRCGQYTAAQLIARRCNVGKPRHARSLNAILQDMLIDAGATSVGPFDMADLLDALVEQAKDATLGLYGHEVADAFGSLRREMLRTNDNVRTIPLLLMATENDETARDYTISAIKSYFLIKSIVDGSKFKVRELLAHGASPIVRCRYDGTLYTPIVAAARSRNTEICKMIIEAGADVNQTQYNSETALANASQLGDCDMLVLLLVNGADPNAVTYVGTALAVAANLAVVMILVAWGADPNIGDRDGDLPIVGFIDQGQYAIVQALVDLGSDLGHSNKNGETPVARARRRGDNTMVDIVIGKRRYETDYSVNIPQEYARVLERKIYFLRRLAYPPDVYQNHGVMRDLANVTQAQLESFDRAIELSRRGLEAKRCGDLVSANALYMDAFSGDIIPRTANIWGWFQVLLVAKNFRDALLVLRYYHAVSASYNCILRGMGEIDHDIEIGLIPDCFLTMEFDAFQVLQECMRVWPFDRRAVEDKITTYTGLDPALKPYYYGEAQIWRSPYHMSDDQYGLFLWNFVFDPRDDVSHESAWASDSTSKMESLEDEVRSGNIEAYALLAELILEEDERRAIELCEQAVERFGDKDATFILALLLEDSDPKKSKELYQRLIDAGSCYAAAYNLARLVEGEDPARAAELFQMAIDDGNRDLAPVGLAGLIEAQDPERAIALYEMAFEEGNTVAFTGLVTLLESRDFDRAVRLCKQAIEAGDVYNGSHLLGMLLQDRDVEQSIRYSEMAIEAGNHFWPPCNIATLIDDQDRDKAIELYKLSAEAGNNFARIKLARLIHMDDKQEAVKLCEMAVDSGDRQDGAFFLAWLLQNEDVERSKELYQLCIDNGYCAGASNNLGLLARATDQQRAIELFKLAIKSGNSYFAPANLADMIASDNPGRAAELYQASIDAGNLAPCAKLARMLIGTDRERAQLLCEQAVSAGDRGDAAFLLAWLLESTDLERAKELYQACVDAGNCWGAGRNLGNLVKDEDPARAADLYEKALLAGNKEMRVPLAKLLLDSDSQRAIQLCEEAVADGDSNDGLHWLAYMLANTDKSRAIELYQKRIDCGNFCGSAYNLANLIERDNPEYAIELYKMELVTTNRGIACMAIANLLAYTLHLPEEAAEYYEMAMESGQDKDAIALNTYGLFLMTRNRRKAIELFRQAIEAGNQSCASCNLGHMFFLESPEDAETLYRTSIENEAQDESTEAYIGLSLLVRESDPRRSDELLRTAMSRDNFETSIEFMADYYQNENPAHSNRLRDLAVGTNVES